MRPIGSIDGMPMYSCEVGDIVYLPGIYGNRNAKVIAVNGDGQCRFEKLSLALYPILSEGFKIVSECEELVPLTQEELDKAVPLPSHEELGKFLGF